MPRALDYLTNHSRKGPMTPAPTSDTLNPHEAASLRAIETELGRAIPSCEETDPSFDGYIAEGGRVVELSIGPASPSPVAHFTKPLAEKFETLSDRVKPLMESYAKTFYQPFRKIRRIPAAVFQLSALRVLLLDCNNLTEITPEVARLRELRVLCVQFNQLSAVPEDFTTLPHLEELGLAGNHLTRLPDTIGRLRNLDTLLASENQIRALPESIGDLAKLTLLILANNQLTHLPNSFGDLTNLVELDLKWNDLEGLPASFENLRNLEGLGLYGNPRLPQPLQERLVRRAERKSWKNLEKKWELE